MIRAAVPHLPIRSLAVLAASLKKEGHEVKILDLSISNNPDGELVRHLAEYSPEYAGITFTTPLFPEALKLSRRIKEISPCTRIVAGGVHATSLPEETLLNSEIDIVVSGEGDITFPELVSGRELKTIKGIYFREGGSIVSTPRRERIGSLDELPFPDWSLFDLKKYRSSRICSRQNPVGPLTTSRGCVYECSFCNKNIFGREFRVKSPARVIEEIKYMLSCGFKEIHIWDDQFTTDLERAKEICRLIKANKLHFPWNIWAGVRVDSVDMEFLRMAKDTGCYAISYGPESGDEKILGQMHKNITLAQSRNAFRMAKDAGLETVAFFMFGMPAETINSMEETINFAIELSPEYAKVTLALPFPSTALLEELDREGRIKSKDWGKYNFHDTEEVWEHPNLSWKVLNRYYRKFYRKFYLRLSYILPRLKRSIKERNIFFDIYYAFRTFFPGKSIR
ncbi:MAG: radical SAM protein [Candidatus Omnitrophica bacterium]|nr:radical SAM protein [Candidatus Omnitrophota bacterium]